jgi:hypothetical protein
VRPSRKISHVRKARCSAPCWQRAGGFEGVFRCSSDLPTPAAPPLNSIVPEFLIRPPYLQPERCGRFLPASSGPGSCSSGPK